MSEEEEEAEGEGEGDGEEDSKDTPHQSTPSTGKHYDCTASAPVVVESAWERN